MLFPTVIGRAHQEAPVAIDIGGRASEFAVSIQPIVGRVFNGLDQDPVFGFRPIRHFRAPLQATEVEMAAGEWAIGPTGLENPLCEAGVLKVIEIFRVNVSFQFLKQGGQILSLISRHQLI